MLRRLVFVFVIVWLSVLSCASVSRYASDRLERKFDGLYSALCWIKRDDGYGSGSLIKMSGNGSVYVLTAEHVAPKGKQVDVTFWVARDVSFTGEVIWSHKGYDVSVIALNHDPVVFGVAPLDVDVRSRVRLGEPLLVGGSTFVVNFIDYDDELAPTVEYSRVSRVESDTFLLKFPGWYGYSGGPVIRAADGKLVGFVSRFESFPNLYPRAGVVCVLVSSALKEFPAE